LPTQAEVVAFYDGWRDQLVRDRQVRNGRVVSALAFAKAELRDCRTILDVGCGVGWSTEEMAASGAQVTGLDLSPVLIAEARRRVSASFICADFPSWEPDAHYDAVLMIDVYEHFRRELRPEVHRRIAETDARRLVLTVPALKTHRRGERLGVLQPIDEPVYDEDVEQLAQDLGGEILVNRTVSVSRPRDYRHVSLAIPR
jgi:SAM-dependent methyltransferase